MFDWFNSRKALESGVALADKLTPAIRSDQPDAKLNAPALQHILSLATVQTRNLTLNFYQRAKLANAFKWRLIENGIGRKVADEVTQALIVDMMSRKR